jgi:selenium-binding protein 1
MDERSSTLHASPAEALKAPPEKLLYLACMRVGTGVEAPDFLAVVDAEDGRIVHETPMPILGDELHHSAGTAAARHATDRIART